MKHLDSTAKTRDFTADIAVVIGVADYAPAIGRLETPVHDAEEVAKLLSTRFGYKVILQCDGAASLDGLRGLLRRLRDRVPAGSRILVYFAGHGLALDNAEVEGPNGYLVPHGASSEVLSHLPMLELYRALEELPCRHLLVILDCCFSGSFRWASQRPMNIPGELLYEERYRHWVRHPARWVLTSAAHNEYALDTPNRRRGQRKGHSPFAAALLDGLGGKADTHPEGGDGIVTIAELYAYLQSRLVPHQSPLLAPLPGQTRGEFVFRDSRRPGALPSAEVEVALEPGTNPYRGLKPYGTDHAHLFFGRGEATRLLHDHLEIHPLSMVVGPSGSGKSSLIHAGLLPRLQQETGTLWITPPPFRVAGDPTKVLHDTLVAVSGSSLAPEKGLLDSRRSKAWIGSWTADHPFTRLLLVVDQAEELVTHFPSRGTEGRSENLAEEATRFLACLTALVRDGGDQVRIVVAVRSDFEADLEDGLRSLSWRAGRFVVPPLLRADLREIIEGPAASKALYFEDPVLVDRLVDEVWGMPGGLPLLSYALSQLFLIYVKRSRGDRLLTASDLEAIGSEAGNNGDEAVATGSIIRVLRKGADLAVAKLPDERYRQTLWRVLLRMVNRVGTRTTRRQVPKDELVYPSENENRRVETVLDQFIDEARLLVSDQDDEDDLIEPAHDQLLVAWPELVRRIDEARVFLPVHRRLTEASKEYSTPAIAKDTGRRPKTTLDLKLLGLVESSSLPEGWLNKIEADYVTAARRARRIRTARRWAIAAAILLLTASAALIFRFQSQVARSRELSALALASDTRDRGLLLAEAAYRIHPTQEARASLFSLLSTLRHAKTFLHGYPPSGVRSMAFSPDGRLVAAGGYLGKILIWDLSEPRQPQWSYDPPPDANGRENDVHALDFTADGTALLAAYEWGGVRLWQLGSSESQPISGWPQPSRGTSEVSSHWEGADPEPSEERGERPVTSLVLFGSGQQAVAGDFSGRLFGIDVTTAETRWSVQLDLINIDRIEVVPEQNVVVAADTFGHLRAIEPSSRASLAFSVQPHRSQLVALRHLPERQQLLSLDSLGRLVHWRQDETGFVVAQQRELPLLPTRAGIDLARERLLIAQRGGEVLSFSLDSGDDLRQEALVGHRLTPLVIRCSTTLPHCISGAVGGEVILWERHLPHPLLERVEPPSATVDDVAADSQPPEVQRLRPRPGNATRLAVASHFLASADVRSLRLSIWERQHPEAPFFETQLEQMPTILRFSPDERLLAIGHVQGQLTRLDLSQTPPRMLKAQEALPGPIFALTFSPDGKQLLTGSGAADRHIRQWDPSSLKLVREFPERHATSLSVLGFSPDSRMLASGSDDGEVVLWATDTWREMGSLPHSPDTLFESIRFDPGSTRLETTSDNGMWTWRISDKDLLEAACRIANRTIEPTEWDRSVGGSIPDSGCTDTSQLSR